MQDKHYDRHDYLDEKRAALETLQRLLTGQPADVVPITRRSRSISRHSTASSSCLFSLYAKCVQANIDPAMLRKLKAAFDASP